MHANGDVDKEAAFRLKRDGMFTFYPEDLHRRISITRCKERR